MRRLLFPIAALLLSDALLIIGHGVQMTLVPLRAEIEGFSPSQVAFTGSMYFLGFVLGCLVTQTILRRVGHIRAFAVLATSFSATVLLFDAFPYFEYWLALRFVVGCCISGLYMIIESWLNDTASKENRGTVLSVYTIINLMMLVVGQQLLNFADPSATTLFVLASIMLSLAIIPVGLTTALAPAPVQSIQLDFKRVWQISHVAVLGSVFGGLVTGAFWSLGPVFARGIGLETTELTFYMSAVVLGGAMFQLPLGRLSDRFDRRIVLQGSALAGALLSILVVLFHQSFSVLLGLSLAWGGCIMTMYAIFLAHGADNAEPDEFAMLGSCILLTFGIASAVGGPLASVFVELLGAVGLYIHSALALVALAFVITVRRKQHVLSPADDTGPFRAATGTSPAIFELDPRTESDEWENKPPSADLDLTQSAVDVAAAGETLEEKRD